MATGTSVPVSARVSAFSYAIRNIVAEAKKVEAAGRTVTYLNIGDPIQFGFKTPPHLIEAVERAMRDGHNGYVPSAGIPAAREAVAGEYERRGMPVTADRVVITQGTSEGIELALSVLADAGDEVLVPTPTYPLYTAVLAKIGARAVYYRTDPDNHWLPDLDDLRRRITPATRALVVIDPNNPTGAVYPESTRRALIDLADRAGLTILADEVYGDVAFDGPAPLLGALAPDAPIISFSSLSKAYLAPGWRTGLARGRTVEPARRRAGGHPEDGRRPAVQSGTDAICDCPGARRAIGATSATFARALAERADITTARLNAMPGMRCVTPRAAFYAMPQRDAAARHHRPDVHPRAAARRRAFSASTDRASARPADGLLPHRLPGLARRAAADLRRHGRVHGGVPDERG